MFFFWLLGVTKFQRKDNEVFGQNWAVSVFTAVITAVGSTNNESLFFNLRGKM